MELHAKLWPASLREPPNADTLSMEPPCLSQCDVAAGGLEAGPVEGCCPRNCAGVSAGLGAERVRRGVRTWTSMQRDNSVVCLGREKSTWSSVQHDDVRA